MTATTAKIRAQVLFMLPFLKAWADGEVLEYKPPLESRWYTWSSGGPPPSQNNFAWRIKTAPRTLYRIEHEDGRMYSSTFIEQEAKDIVYRTGQQNHTRHLKLTIVPYLEQPHG